MCYVGSPGRCVSENQVFVWRKPIRRTKTLTRNDTLPSVIELDKTHVQALITQMGTFERFCRFGNNTEDSKEGIRYEKPICENSQSISIATKDVASIEVANDICEAKARGISVFMQNVESRLVTKSTNFAYPMKKLKSRIFAIMYQVTFTTNQRKQVVKIDRRLL